MELFDTSMPLHKPIPRVPETKNLIIQRNPSAPPEGFFVLPGVESGREAGNMKKEEARLLAQLIYKCYLSCYEQ